jgi:cell wall-associated NlpC family hydrolase
LNLRAKISGVVIITAVVAGLLPSAIAQGSPLEDKQRQAAQLESQIQANLGRMEVLAEKLNGARFRMEKAQAGIAESERRTTEAQAETDKIDRQLNARAAEIYKGAGSSNPLDAIDVSNVTELAARSKYASAAADKDDSLLDRLQKARELLAIQKAQLEQQKAAATAERDAADKARRDLESANAQRKQLLSQVKGQVQVLINQERARRDAANLAQARSRAQGGTGGRSGGRGSVPVNMANVPAPNPGAQAAVNFAKAQIGKGYRYATSGPDTFDCSGLTAAAWAAGGKSLAHYSGAQYQQTIRIGSGDLKPGDLVFYGPGGSNHVEIYIGGGQVVSASNPETGVKLAGLRGSAIGYGRVG